jgi:hypothetical protein
MGNHYFLVSGRKGEKDLLISFSGDEFANVYIYELKETIEFKKIIKPGLKGEFSSTAGNTNAEVAVAKWIKERYGREPFRLI